MHDGGRLLGGIELLLISCLCPQWINVSKIRKIWILVLLNVGHLLFFLVASWYHFVSSVYIVLILCFTQGILHGSTIVHSLASTADAFVDTTDKGIALGMVEVGPDLGRLAAGLLGLFIEKYIRDHCTNRLLQGRFCFARSPSSLGWSENLSCK